MHLSTDTGCEKKNPHFRIGPREIVGGLWFGGLAAVVHTGFDGPLATEKSLEILSVLWRLFFTVCTLWLVSSRPKLGIRIFFYGTNTLLLGFLALHVFFLGPSLWHLLMTGVIVASSWYYWRDGYLFYTKGWNTEAKVSRSQLPPE